MNCVLIGIVVAVLAGGSVAGGPKVEIIAHRGESADAPENTMAAFNLAWKRHDDAIELDVHLTKDGELIVCHDPDTKRITGLPAVIKDTAIAELRRMDAGSWKGGAWAGEKLPTLDEVLATIPEGKRCFIEIKVGPEAVPAVEKAVRQSGKKPEQLVIISFHADTLALAKRRMPELKAYYLSSFKQDKESGVWSPTVDQLISKANSIGADGLDVSYKGPLDHAFVKKVKDANLGFYVWTVDDLAVARRMVELGVQGITTNKAAWLKDHLLKKD